MFFLQSASLDVKTAEKVKEALDFCSLVENSVKLVVILASFALFVFEVRKMNQLQFGQKRPNKLVEINVRNDVSSKNNLNNSDEAEFLTQK